jgi:hypothetical protein
MLVISPALSGDALHLLLGDALQPALTKASANRS